MDVPRGRAVKEDINTSEIAIVYEPGTYRTLSDVATVERRSEIQQDPKERTSNRRWFVLLAGWLNMFLCTGFPFNMSVLNLEFLREFGSSKAETALVQSVITGILYIAGVAFGKIVSKYGNRRTGIVGALVTSLGIVSSLFATSVPYLIVTLGVVSGIGLSACYISSLTSIGGYFTGKSKLLAISFIVFGSGCGALVFPFLLDFLIQQFGWRGCLLIVGGIMANMIPFFALCKPVSMQEPSPKLPCESEKGDSKAAYQPESDGFMKTLKTLALNKSNIAFVLAMCCTLPVINSALIFLLDFLQTQGFDSKTALVLYFCLQVANMVCQLVPGLCKQVPHTSVLTIPAFFTAIGTVACVLLPNAETYTQHVILLIGLGMTLGTSIATIPMATLKVVGLKDYSAGLGTVITLIGIGNVCAGPLSGFLQDMSGSFVVSFYTMAAALGLSTALFLLSAALRKCNGENSELK